MKEILDMDKFILEQVYRPYQSLLEFSWGNPFRKMPHSVNTIMWLLKEKNEWSKLVLDRIIRCNFKFNKWLKHPFIDFIKEYKGRKL